MGTTGETTAMGTRGPVSQVVFRFLESAEVLSGNPDTPGLIYYCTEESVASTLDTESELTMTLDFLYTM